MQCSNPCRRTTLWWLGCLFLDTVVIECFSWLACAGAHDLELPMGEQLLRSYPCLKYGKVRNKAGNLYLCSSMLIFDHELSSSADGTTASRLVIKYHDISHLKSERGLGFRWWVSVQYGVGVKVEFGGGDQASAQEMLSEISRMMANC